MQYEIISFKKIFATRYKAEVLCTPALWQRILLFKKTCIRTFTGFDQMWFDHDFNFVGKKVCKLLADKWQRERFMAIVPIIAGAVASFVPQLTPVLSNLMTAILSGSYKAIVLTDASVGKSNRSGKSLLVKFLGLFTPVKDGK